jgi:hypothetical protein
MILGPTAPHIHISICTHLDITPVTGLRSSCLRIAADVYPEWLREQARRRHSNLAAGFALRKAPRCYFLPDYRER